jgi:hypothetical protein
VIGDGAVVGGAGGRAGFGRVARLVVGGTAARAARVAAGPRVADGAGAGGRTVGGTGTGVTTDGGLLTRPPRPLAPMFTGRLGGLAAMLLATPLL